MSTQIPLSKLGIGLEPLTDAELEFRFSHVSDNGVGIPLGDNWWPFVKDYMNK